jgi:hypothetical protein
MHRILVPLHEAWSDPFAAVNEGDLPTLVFGVLLGS